ncbi:tRNA (guanine(9)-N1)-methyltransferase [Rhodotorula toruloides]|uniref:tRNA (guanine(9)-N1)-methyltransferase n=2 Tax=Rhodotorula toruloides TaxID=5286 RepID=A0A2T0AGV4_RHOTO|nr:tRNA (guanine(9)-N1)-methyltransferase [Rhodotorula toruloides]PRQ77239.1 tRNA (Guanine-1)-methyltransferase-domain containing protein [Rhodotorula toruloides]
MSTSTPLPPSIDQASAPASTSGPAANGAAPTSEALTAPSADAQLTASTSTSTLPPGITKSALKRQRKQEAFQAKKLVKRQQEKERKKAKAAEIKRLVAEGVMEKPESKKRKKAGGEPHGARIVIDMGFDELMTEKEVKSMASQLAYCYSANRASPHPFPILVTSFNGRLREGYDKRGDFKSWKGVEWWDDGVEKLWDGVREVAPADEAAETATSAGEASSAEAPVASTPSIPLNTLGVFSGQPCTRVPRSTVTYLTGDSPNVLTSLTPGHTYILGGIVDRNRYKNLCLNKANSLGIAHAQLPIGEYLPEMQTRKVLTVNQVFEILVNWVEAGEKDGKEGWGEALRKVMPERKFDPDARKKRREARKKAGEAVSASEDEGEIGQADAGVYVAEDEDEGEEVQMVVDKVDEVRGEAEVAEARKEAEAVVSNVDAEEVQG